MVIQSASPSVPCNMAFSEFDSGRLPNHGEIVPELRAIRKLCPDRAGRSGAASWPFVLPNGVVATNAASISHHYATDQHASTVEDLGYRSGPRIGRLRGVLRKLL